MRLFCLLILLATIALSGCLARGVSHIVQPGQTLYRIGKTYHVPVGKIIAYNRIKDPTQIKVGQSLWIPGVDRTRTVSVLPVKKKATTAKKHSSIAPKKVKKSAPVSTYSKRSTAKKIVKKSSTKAKKGQFAWPVNGKVVTKFNLSSRIPSKGIDIAARIGTGVESAAAGKVIYSGNGISGYGHVVIVEHDHSLYTVYGYNKKVFVTSGCYVNSGQKIALVGTPPGGVNGRLHFEVWKNKKAVNPAFYLP